MIDIKKNPEAVGKLKVGTSSATPADGEVVATGVKAETYRSARSDGDVYIQAATASDFVAIGTQVSSTLLKLDGNGNLMLGTPAAGSAGAILHISSAAPRIRLEDTSAPANYSQISADNGQLTLAADGGQGQASSAIIAQVDSYERMRIDSSGGVKVVGSGSTGAILWLENTTTNAAADDIAGTVNFYANDASLPSGGRVCGYVRSVADDQYNRYGLRFGTANFNETVQERMSISATGLATFNNGIAFSQTNSSATGATATGTTLSHFETGTWTPVHAAAASTSGTWNSTLTGTYTRIGNLVSVNLRITGTSMDFSSVSGYRGYSGLPFAPASDGAGSYDSFHTTSTIGTAAAFTTGSTLYLHPARIGTGTSVIFATVQYKV